MGDSPASEFYIPTFRNTVSSIFIGGVNRKEKISSVLFILTLEVYLTLSCILIYFANFVFMGFVTVTLTVFVFTLQIVYLLYVF